MRVLWLVALAGSAAASGAQVIETPIPLDSAGRVVAITPPLAARLSLAPPAWPATGDYVEVRLFEQSTGGYVLVVHRRSGVLERHLLTREQRDALQSLISTAMLGVGRPAAEERADLISESARGAFVRNQLLLALTIYSGSLAALTDDGQTATAVYLLSAGGTFFLVGALARGRPISRAQNHLSTDGAVRGSLLAQGVLEVLADDPDRTARALATLIGGVGGTLAGVTAGRALTDGEAHAATWGSTTLALTALGAVGTTGVLDDPSRGEERAAIGAIVAAALVGYPVGLRYPRRASYVVTAGDVGALSLAGKLGAAAGATLVAEDDADERVIFALGTAGLLAGTLVGDRAFVRRYDYTEGEARLLAAGAGAGALIGGSVVALTEPDDPRVTLGLITAGAVAGTAVTHVLAAPRRAIRVGLGQVRERRLASGRRAPVVEVTPTGLALAVGGVPGRFSVLRVAF